MYDIFLTFLFVWVIIVMKVQFPDKSRTLLKAYLNT